MDNNQFQYLTPTESQEHLRLMQVASEQLLKDIGVDLQKFLARDGQAEDQLLASSLSQNRSPNVPPSYQMSLPSLQSLGTVNSTQVLDMKFRQQQMNRYMPTDEEVDQFRENHKQRMQRMEERFMQNDMAKVEQEMEVEEEEKERMFMKSARGQMTEEAEDLELEDLSDFEDKPVVYSTKEKIVMVKKNQADKEQEKALVTKLINQMALEEKKDEDSDSDFGNINTILDNGLEEKVYDFNEAKLPIQLQSINDPVDVDPQTKEKFSQYMSWSTTTKQIGDTTIAGGVEADKYPDPHIVGEGDSEQEQEGFRYNEHGIYSDHSEDEESFVYNP